MLSVTNKPHDPQSPSDRMPGDGVSHQRLPSEA